MILNRSNGKAYFLVNLRCCLDVQKVPVDVCEVWILPITISNEEAAIDSVIARAALVSYGIADLLKLPTLVPYGTTSCAIGIVLFNDSYTITQLDFDP